VEGSFEDDGDGILRPRTIAEGRSLKNALEGKAHISRFRKMAQEWVESPFTEFLIMLLLCLDLSLTIWEAATPNDSKVRAGVDVHSRVCTHGVRMWVGMWVWAGVWVWVCIIDFFSSTNQES